ncbi:MAG: 3-deoxy-7-phosphoheptulonate synthase [Candidatus Omnitrophica bacterium]|nr:3-deoxy-7-phosphoheptulonate synthase [Candidatus Omnitrophota bacterium]
MIIVLQPGATEENIRHILEKTEAMGLRANVSRGAERTVIGLIGPEDKLQVVPLEVFPGVERVMPVLAPYKLVSREFKGTGSVVKVGSAASGLAEAGGKRLVVMAGPCAIEGYDMLLAIAKKVKAAGANMLRGGAFKPRTSPYDFQGMGEEGLKILQAVGKEAGIATVTEVMDPRDVELVARYADMFQIGARNMQNFSLLREVGKARKSVLLKRGISSTIKEWLMSAEYILAQGNYDVVLCERGIRTFETETRNTLDINAIPVVKQKSHLPIIVDPSHGTGKSSLVGSIAKAGVAAGADGVLIEVHESPEDAWSDGAQCLTGAQFKNLMQELAAVANAVGREI